MHVTRQKKIIINKIIYIQTDMADYLWKALLAEFVGTFTLVFVGASAVALTIAQGGSLLSVAFAFGLALMTIIYIWGSYSGAHVNPAVSFGFAVAGQMNWGLMLGYWIAQLLGGIAAAALVAYFFGTATGAGASIGSFTNTDAWKAVLMEAFLTFFLVLAYLFIYRNPFLAIISGVAIGLVLTFATLAGGPLTGASTNPARSLGPAIFSNNMGTWWIYVVGPLLGALVAALIYKLFTANFNCCDKVDECGNKILDECGRPLRECKRPLVDNCGKPIKDCDGNQVWDTYTKHERKLGHMQETPLLTMGEFMSAHGFDPRYIRQEVGHAVEKVIPNGVVDNPPAVIQSLIQSVSPQPSSTVVVATSPSPGYPSPGSPAAQLLSSQTLGTPPSQLMGSSSAQLMSQPQSTILTVSQPNAQLMSTQAQGFVPTLQSAATDALRVPNLASPLT
jgi:MIP family channel proteins